MSSLSMRHFIQSRGFGPGRGIRQLAPVLRAISLRSLMSSFRIIHISDLHFTTTLSIDEPQDSEKKRRAIEEFLINNKSLLGTNIIIITGDITDKGNTGDYKIAQSFIQRLQANDAGYLVSVNPGNHDYCREGILALTPPPERLIARNLFVKYVSGNDSKYPHIVDFDNGQLILLDSMQAQLDEITLDLDARGKLGTYQLAELENKVSAYQAERQVGKKLIVSLHHSPFARIRKDCDTPLVESDFTKGLHDGKELLDIIRSRIDGLLFGHVTPPGQDHRPSQVEIPLFADAEKSYGIPLINCENLEPMNSSYSVTVLDFGSYQRTVFQTDTSKVPGPSWGVPSN